MLNPVRSAIDTSKNQLVAMCKTRGESRSIVSGAIRNVWKVNCLFHAECA